MMPEMEISQLFRRYLQRLINEDGSDLYLTAQAHPRARFHGKMTTLDDFKISAEQLESLFGSLLNEKQQAEFARELELNFAFAETDIGRFRINLYRQRDNLALVARLIKDVIPVMDELGLPEILKQVILSQRGLILFVGATGSGKSTSLAAMIGYRNRNAAGHIITIEDPIEFMHSHEQSLVSQREVGIDTHSYENALKNTLRQAPDVIQIGEIRSRETMEYAMTFAETGHLCVSTLHANNSDQALERIINFFPEEKRNQLLLDLSLNLKAFVSQRLVPTVDGKRAAAIEVMLGTPLVKDLIRRGDLHEIKEIMGKSENLGMQTFDSHLFQLYCQDKISMDEALRNADSENNLRLKINLRKADEGDGEDKTNDPLSLSPMEAKKKPETKAAPARQARRSLNIRQRQ